MTIEAMLAERGASYGEYADGAKIAMDMFAVAQAGPSYQAMTAAQQYAVFMILAKLSRMLNGNPNEPDNFRDIIGYSTLVLETLTGDDK